MPLVWDLTKVKKYEQLQKTEAGITDALIYATMTVGIPKITETNADEFYARIHLVEMMTHPWLNNDGEEVMFTRENITDRVGLTTNATTFSRAEFIKRRMKYYFSDYVKEDK